MFVKKTSYDRLLAEKENLELDVLKLTADLNEKIEELERLKSHNSDELSSFTIQISEDLRSAKPIGKISNKEIVRKMVEGQYLPANKTNDEFAVQLALALVASEALEQIIFSFEESLKDVSHDTED